MVHKICWFIPLLFAFGPGQAQNNIGLFEKCNYGGKKSYLKPGSYKLYQMGISNDQLSSLQIPNGLRVTLYENDNFKGKSSSYTSSIPCLTNGWNDNSSSLVVESLNSIYYNENDFVTFYNDCYAKGYSQSLRPGTYNGSQLGLLKYNISSFTISGNLRVKVYTDNENASGYSTGFDVSQACLINSFNDKIGSVVIEYKPNSSYSNNNTYNNNYGNSSSYVSIYTGCNYNGSSLRLAPGYYSGDKLGLLKYDISSIEIPSNLKAKVFVNNEYMDGNSYSLSENINCLSSTLNDRIGSIVIEEKYSSGYNPNYNQNSDQQVVVYSDENYKGLSASLLPGTYATMQQAGFVNDALSSLTIPPGYRVVLYEFENFKGKTYTVTQSKPGFILSSWNDKASSIAVYKQ